MALTKREERRLRLLTRQDGQDIIKTALYTKHSHHIKKVAEAKQILSRYGGRIELTLKRETKISSHTMENGM